MNKKAGEIIFVTGFEKNCGKTTFLNYLLSKQKKDSRVICASIGVTSKEDEFLNNTQKPEVKIKAGWMVLSNTHFLKNIDVPYKIEDIIDEDIAGGRPVIITPLYDCSVRLFSPGSNSKIFEIITRLTPHIDFAFIDGAFDRITQVSSFKNASFYYVFKVEPHNIEDVISKINLFESFGKVPININNYDFMKNIEDDVVLRDILFIKGALTYQKLSRIPKNIRKIFISDFTKVFLNIYDWMNLQKNYSVFFVSHFKLSGYVINLYDVDRNEFESKISNEALKKVIYNPYEN